MSTNQTSSSTLKSFHDKDITGYNARYSGVRGGLVFLILVLLAVELIAAQTPEQRYFDWTRLPFPADEYLTRRVRLAEQLRTHGTPIFVTASGAGISHSDTFRPLNDFLYLTGLEFPDAILALDAESAEATVFVAPRDPRFENRARPNDFPGRPLADDPSLESRTGLTIRRLAEFDVFLQRLQDNGSNVLGVNIGHAGEIGVIQIGPTRGPSPEETLVTWLRHERSFAITNVYDAVARVRMVKSDLEIAVMRRAAEITASGIAHAATFIAPGVAERTLEGVLEASFKRHGAQRLAFSSIIKSGPNSLWPWRILASHYDRRNRRMERGDLVVFDVGAEYNYYVSDVGRTFPVSGTFTDRQRSVLAMQLAVSDAIIAAVRPGVTFGDLQRVAEEAIPPEHKPFMQAGLFFGHHLGLDTGDPSLPDTPLEPGMIFTVEPWYYNHAEGISVFTEDEILVTTTDAELLTRHLPRTPEDLELLMATGGRRMPR